MQYRNQERGPDAPWAIGTGWLIKDDLIVTAAHNAYDWRYGFGPAASVKAYIGYYGKQTVDDPSVQYRAASRVTTTTEWMTDGNNRASDVAFLQLDPPFTGVTPFKFANTPANGNDILGVVGYPGDKLSQTTGEAGDRLWEEFQTVNYDLDKAPRHMLNYSISTFGGRCFIVDSY